MTIFWGCNIVHKPQHIIKLLLQDVPSENIGEGDDSANVGPVSMLGALNHLAGGCHVPPVTLCDIETAF